MTVDNEDGFLLPDGCYRPYQHAKNEMEGFATDDDPFGLRLGKDWHGTDDEGLNLAKISGNKRRPQSGIHDEVALLRFRMAPNRKDGAIECVVTRDGVEVPAFYLDPNVFLSYLTIQAPSFIGKLTRFYSDHNVFCVNFQDDQIDPATGRQIPKMTCYDTRGPNGQPTDDERQWHAVGQFFFDTL